MGRHAQRGAAIVELAVVMPLFVLLLLLGLYSTELVLAQLELQEASRYLGWELTSYPLADYGSGKHERAFRAAADAAVSEARQRYRALNSAASFGMTFEGFKASVQDGPVSFAPSAPLLLTGDGGPWSARAQLRVARGARALLEDFQLDLGGQVTAELSVKLRSTVLPGPAELVLRSRLTLVATGWQLPDGADASIAGGRAGNHNSGVSPSGLWLQVNRMRFLGDEDFVTQGLPMLGPALDVMPLSLPSLSGTFVVSHNYGPGPACEGIPGYPSPSNPAQDARGGLSRMKDLLDHPRPACFDTAPFRDTQRYEGSLALQMFHARGPYFMGCQRPQADDPSSPRDTNLGDRNVIKTDCEEPR